MLHVSSQLTTQMPRDQRIYILCIISSRSKNGLPSMACFTSSKMNPMTAREYDSCRTLAVIGYGST